MADEEQRIEIPTPEEVARYGAPAGGTAETPSAGPPGDRAGQGAPESPEGAAPAATDELAAARAEAQQWKDRALRAMAELQNFQRRSAQERNEAIRYANAGFARDLLGVVDDLERALAHVGTPRDDGDAVVQALRMIHEGLLKVLRDHDVEPIESVGRPFDPAVHQAIAQQASPEHPEPVVLHEVQKGYRMHERVLRPARVIVSAGAGPEAAAPPAEGVSGQS